MAHPASPRRKILVEAQLVEGETIARAPQGWMWQLDVAKGSTLQALRIRRG